MNVKMINKIEREKLREKFVHKVTGQHLIFKSYVNGVKIKIFIDNGSEVEFIDKSYAHRHKFNIFKLEKRINLILGNEKKKRTNDRNNFN